MIDGLKVCYTIRYKFHREQFSRFDFEDQIIKDKIKSKRLY